MKTLPLTLPNPPPLSDEAAGELLDWLYEFTVAFEKHYADQLRRYYQSRIKPLDNDFFSDDDMPF